MKESKRQRQVAMTIQRALSDIFQKEASEILSGALVTIAYTQVSPDLQLAKVYLSIYNTEKPQEIFRYIEDNNKQIRRLLGNRLRHQLRKIPELNFYQDHSLDEVFRLEELFKEINKKKDT